MPQLISYRQSMKEFRFLMQGKPNKALYKKLTSCESQPVKLLGINLSQGFELVRVNERQGNNEFELVLLDHVGGQVAYYNRVTMNPDVELNAKPVTQICVWRSNRSHHRRAVSGIARHLFQDYLLKRYNVVVTDSHQTQAGFNFWLDRINDALDADYHVYFYEQMTGKLSQIKDEDALQEQIDHIWSEEMEAQSRLVILSEGALPNDSPLDDL